MYIIGLKWITQDPTTIFDNSIEMHLQRGSPEENLLPLRQLVYKEINQKEKRFQ